jgi:hypothetical protein
MYDFKWLGLGLVLGMVHAACDGGDDEPADTGAVTTAVPGEGSTNPADGGDEADDEDSGEPGDDSHSGGEGSTSDGPEPDPTSGEDSGGDASSGGDEAPGDPSTGVRGAVVRSVAPAVGEDAIGTLYVGLLVECTADSASAGGATPVDADLSAAGSQVLYEVTGVAPGTYYLVAFLDDNLNANASDPYADNKDLVTAEGFAPGCVQVTVVDGEIATAPAPIDLNLVYPL